MTLRDHIHCTSASTCPIIRGLRLIPILIIHLYQHTLGAILPPSCRFTPTCSQYAIEAYTKHGIIRGTWLTLKRLLRCNPYCRSGHDPVP